MCWLADRYVRELSDEGKAFCQRCEGRSEVPFPYAWQRLLLLRSFPFRSLGSPMPFSSPLLSSLLFSHLSLRQGEKGAEQHVFLVADEPISVDINHGQKSKQRERKEARKGRRKGEDLKSKEERGGIRS